MSTVVSPYIRRLHGLAKGFVYRPRDRVFREWFMRHAGRISAFKDKHKGQDCFVIGNGPSLNSMDLTHLNQYYTFGLNKIYLMFDRVDLKLRYHVAVNPLVIQQSARVFESFSFPTFLSYRAARGVVQAKDHLFFVMTSGNPIGFQPELTETAWEGRTVTYMALQIAYYMGFERVFLIGVDHNFTTIGNPNEKQFLSGSDPNHFDPNYFGNQEWHLPDLEASELAYRIAKYQYKLEGRQIYDATTGGKLQVFDKISYEEALRMCKKSYD